MKRSFLPSQIEDLRDKNRLGVNKSKVLQLLHQCKVKNKHSNPQLLNTSLTNSPTRKLEMEK